MFKYTANTASEMGMEYELSEVTRGDNQINKALVPAVVYYLPYIL